ncbi:MAG TPA: ATP-binding cassette domain-containing protein [Allosphingosinicella sp.]|nr:ATP-binding cassette domain-containing protein [Allosphingosinicella sp.]
MASGAFAQAPCVSPPALVALDEVGLTIADAAGRSIRVLRPIRLTVESNEILGILGPSGCGKTSLLRIIAGLLLPTSGTCTWEPEMIAGRGLRMTMAFQRPTLVPWYSVEENALLPFRLAGRVVAPEDRDRLDHLLHLVRLRGFRHSLPHELSGGMQMRAALVRCFLPAPRLILMDEPFSALDESSRIDMGVELLRLSAEVGCSIVFVTHSVTEAAFVSNRVIQMSARPGRVIAETQILHDRPRDPRLIEAPEFLSLCRQLRCVSGYD